MFIYETIFIVILIDQTKFFVMKAIRCWILFALQSFLLIILQYQKSNKQQHEYKTNVLPSQMIEKNHEA